MNSSFTKKPIAMALGAAFAFGGMTAQAGSIFQAADLPSGYTVLAAEGKCGEGKCGEGKCGEGKKHECPADKKDANGKCPEAKCGEGKCGEGKCGADKKK